MQEESMTVSIRADTREFDRAMADLNRKTRDFGNVFSSTISQSIRAGRGFEDTLKAIGNRLAGITLKRALAPVDDLFNSVLGSLSNGIAKGTGSLLASPVVPFAKGGVISSPTRFGFGGQLGLAGEVGAEAIMPLRRGPDGRLGVAAPETGSPSMNIVFNVTASDAASFAKSEGQLTTLLARAVARGQRGL